jgi:hypothetical protein
MGLLTNLLKMDMIHEIRGLDNGGHGFRARAVSLWAGKSYNNRRAIFLI